MTLPYEFDTSDVWRTILKGMFGLTLLIALSLLYTLASRQWAMRPYRRKRSARERGPSELVIGGLLIELVIGIEAGGPNGAVLVLHMLRQADMQPRRLAASLERISGSMGMTRPAR